MNTTLLILLILAIVSYYFLKKKKGVQLTVETKVKDDVFLGYSELVKEATEVVY